MALKMKEKAPTTEVHKSSMFLEFGQRLIKSWSAKVGLFLMLFIILACLVGPYLTGYDLNWQDQSLMRAGPSWDHILGCDTMGRDMLTRLLYGGRYSLLMGILSAVLGAILGIAVGLVAGYFGGITETIIMRFMDVWSSPARHAALYSGFSGHGQRFWRYRSGFDHRFHSRRRAYDPRSGTGGKKP